MAYDFNLDNALEGEFKIKVEYCSMPTKLYEYQVAEIKRLTTEGAALKRLLGDVMGGAGVFSWALSGLEVRLVAESMSIVPERQVLPAPVESDNFTRAEAKAAVKAVQEKHKP